MPEHKFNSKNPVNQFDNPTNEKKNLSGKRLSLIY